MMETMGSLGGGTFYDMLPDKLMIEPYTRSGHPVRCGLYEYTCEACGKRFEATYQHRYKTESKINGSARMRIYCSYRCFRPVEKMLEEQFKADCLGLTRKSGSKTAHQKALERAAICKKKLADLQAIRNDPAVWKALPISKRQTTTTLIGVWRCKLDEAEEALRGFEANENA